MAVFGEFLGPACEHIAAAVSFHGEPPGAARCGVISELGRLVPTLARYMADIAGPGRLDAAGAGQLDPGTRAVLEARTGLRRAAHALGQGTTALQDAAVDGSHPVVWHLSAAAGCLAAGRDLLQTHFTHGPFGGWEPGSYWAPVITSPLVANALLSDVAGCARRLAPWTAWLAATATMGSGVPTAANLALHTATRGLWVAGAAVEAAHRHHTPSTAGRRLLAAIPANLPPPRVVPLEDETVPVLCERAALTAERLRQAAWSFARQARWSPAATSHSWRRAAFASAITGHASELILHLMEERATTLGTEPAVRTQLNQAADAIRQAWHARRVLASEWDILTTGTHKAKAISPVTAELGDLVLRTGRLAYANPRWTPASGTATPRDPASLAPARRDLGAILAAVHHAADALARIAVEDRAAVGTAATDGRLYLPTRLMPAECDIPRRYTPAPRSRTGTLLALYEHVIAADTRAVAALDTLAESLGSPSELLAAARAVSSKPAHAPQPPSERAHRTATVAVGRDRERGRWHLPEPAHRHITPRPGTASASKRPRPAPTSHRQ